METILVIEDDEGLNRGISFTLTREGFQVLSAQNLKQGGNLLKENLVSIIILDLNLPDGDGLDFCKVVRRESDVPIILLTARDLETDEVIGLETGADDYITKPFSLSILKARVSTQLRRNVAMKEKQMQTKLQWITSSNIRLCKENMKVYREGEVIDLSSTEYKILLLFMEHSGQVLLKEQILEAIWDKDANFVDENTLPVNIRRLRKKLEQDPSTPQLIQTIHGMGYIWNERNKDNES
jgi:DNA-binding response OmpR family regulator